MTPRPAPEVSAPIPKTRHSTCPPSSFLALCLPEDRAADEERRTLAGVPDEVMVKTKPQLAGDLPRHAHDRGIRAGFCAGDEGYGSRAPRTGIRTRGGSYVTAVRCNSMLTLPSGRRVSVKKAADVPKPGMWQRMRTGQAAKGARDCDRAMTGIIPDDIPQGHDDGHAVLPLRRHRYTRTVSYCLCRTPEPVPLAALVRGATTRRRTEEDHQVTKQPAGLDSGQVTTWTSWHRRTAPSLTAAAALQRTSDGDTSALEIVPVTVPELPGLLRGTVIPGPCRDKPHRNAWSPWRRHRQYQSQQAHRRWHAYADEIPRAA